MESVLKYLCSLLFQAEYNVDVNTEEDDDGELALWSSEVWCELAHHSVQVPY